LCIHICCGTGFATDILASGGALDEAQALLGHASIASTEAYLHPSQARWRQAVDRVAAYRTGRRR
jgi:site-specific recombinase XerD